MKRIPVLMILVLCVCFLLPGCSVDVEEAGAGQNSTGYYFYYLDEDELSVQKERYRPEQEGVNYMLQDLMQLLGNRSVPDHKAALLPEGVEINSYELQEDKLVIDFNDQYRSVDRTREILMRAGVAETFLQIPGIRTVTFTADGKSLKDSSGQEIGAMTADSFAEYTQKKDETYYYGTFTLYFTDRFGKDLVTEQRNVYYRRTIPKERVVLEQLAKGPMAEGHYPTIPENTDVESVMVSDGICYVGLDEDFADSALELPQEIPVYSVVNSVLDSCKADKVQISVGDHTRGTFGEDMSLYEYYEKNEDLVKAD